MRQSDADYRSILSIIADYLVDNTLSRHNTQKIAGYVRSRVGEENLPKKSSGRVFKKLYEAGIFTRIFQDRKSYFVYIDRDKLWAQLNRLGEPLSSVREDLQADISVSYSLGGQPVTVEFYQKFSSRFTGTEKSVTYTFRGHSVPPELNDLVESALDNDG